MQIHNLQNTPIPNITAAFNKAFETYFVPIKLSGEQLRDKIKSENILLEHSVGVTIEGQLAAFILIGINPETKTAYNAGTGTAPEFRGQKLTEKMYAFLLPELSKIGIRNHLLEVICQNEKALKIYENLDYFISRKLICYKGKIKQPKQTDTAIQTVKFPNEVEIRSFWNHNPTYQNSLFCINNDLERHNIFGKLYNGSLIGYVIFVKDTPRIKQFGVDMKFRNTGIAHDLFYEVQKRIADNEVIVINVDENDLETNGFLQTIGLIPFIEQFEMKKKVN